MDQPKRKLRLPNETRGAYGRLTTTGKKLTVDVLNVFAAGDDDDRASEKLAQVVAAIRTLEASRTADTIGRSEVTEAMKPFGAIAIRIGIEAYVTTSQGNTFSGEETELFKPEAPT